MKTRHKGLLATAVAAATALAVGGAAVGAAGGTAVTVGMGKPSEMAFKLSKTSVPKGPVTFSTSNAGKLKHSFKISGKKTPDLAPGKRATLKVTFAKAGKYKYLCTVPGHAAAGMKGTLTVK